MQDEPRGASGGATPESPGKRPSAAERVRRRYRLARRLLTAAGLAVALAVVAASVAALPDPSAALGRGFLVQCVVLVAAAGAVPWIVVGSLGRHAWRRRL